MLAIELTFTAGRYHATPWGRNVNEGVVEWPPSPYRLARALVDVCRRRRPDWDDERLIQVLRPFQSPPAYYLPSATSSHVRSYLNSNDKDPIKKQKIFDAFVCVDKEAAMCIGFDVVLPPDGLRDLSELLEELDYLGRSESWVKARVVDPAKLPEFNCHPAVGGRRQFGEIVQVACVRTETDYQNLPMRPHVKKGKKQTPLSWIAALSMSTKELLNQGWSAPPAQVTVDYVRPKDALRQMALRKRRPLSSAFKVAQYKLDSTVLPRVIETVPFAERIRTHLMGIHKNVIGGDADAISPLFSGKSPDGGPAKGHEHVFIWPMDQDNDGRIDHLVVKSSKVFETSELEALDRLRSVWQPDGRPDAELVLVSLSKEPEAIASKHWVSATPFVTRRHHRKGRGTYQEWLAGEIRRECSIHGLPAPLEIEFIDHSVSGGHALRWMEFVRSRKGSRPLQGHGCRLTFGEEVAGVFALGALCHFGLGLFLVGGEIGITDRRRKSIW